ncbi:hypothetical protein BGP_5546 [Beggiatoa sp. PS]|nr:hypothetical protein BGP_5546 [Beggiatoa sp. PS]
MRLPITNYQLPITHYPFPISIFQLLPMLDGELHQVALPECLLESDKPIVSFYTKILHCLCHKLRAL